jgi:hypothetical protein
MPIGLLGVVFFEIVEIQDAGTKFSKSSNKDMGFAFLLLHQVPV